jgi:hypothetical protein
MQTQEQNEVHIANKQCRFRSLTLMMSSLALDGLQDLLLRCLDAVHLRLDLLQYLLFAFLLQFYVLASEFVQQFGTT